MNVSTGGSHILFFERDQQLTTLLTSEFQLAGYECHGARTAVEVFDTIAHHPIRLVLVNLAQAAAGRREFWVALDAQRRGRSVQVFTYRCTNLAGYGSEDPDERGRSGRVDIEVDGLLGVMSLVDTVRARIPGSTTGTLPRIPTAPVGHGQTAGQSVAAEVPMSASPLATLSSLPPSATTPNSALAALASSSTPPRQQPTMSVSPAPMEPSDHTTQAYTDNRIRAIIYPNQNPWSVGQVNAPGAQSSYSGPPVASNMHAAPSASSAARPFGGQTAARAAFASDMPGAPLSATQLPSSESGEESGLAQLSRMLQIHTQTDTPREVKQEPQERLVSNSGQAWGDGPNATPINTLPLRASPIQDMPVERAVGGQVSGSSGGTGEQPRQEYRPERSDLSVRAAYPAASMSTSISVRAPSSVPSASPTPVPPAQSALPASLAQTVEPLYPFAEDTFDDTSPLAERVRVEQVQASTQKAPRRRESEMGVASDGTLLDIMQSLPPMPSSPPPTPVLSGRATRSLGRVLLEGHLVPQNRLEVAQNVQRLLRGVDLNYQLGEILLLFKLLTPDQLLAASLVSYGLISTTQISALGRIRQELHSIGLEYDLENLLILFRMLTPEQLREVRANWS
jgi:hypothetical protein